MSQFSLMLRNIQSTNRNRQISAVKETASCIQEATQKDIQELLELLISTYDVQTQVKLMSILAAYLLNGGIHYEIIVKYNPLYETVQNLLIRGLPQKTSVPLNFVMALLCCDDGDQNHLATHARNMLRLSGSLNAMTEMFSVNMMYQDTWVALCQSLAEVCRSNEVNQSYCSHLVPLCVKRCQQGNMDVCGVLQSLINKHDRNIQLFVECGGISIFTRQALQYNMCMQLLNTVVEKSTEAVTVLRSSEVAQHLGDFLRLYGPYSQMGQWSTIILYHLNRNNTAFTTLVMNEHNHNHNINPTFQEKSLQYMDHSPNNRETISSKLDPKLRHNSSRRSVFIGKSSKIADRKDISTNNSKQNLEDTAQLFQNIVKEVLHWKSRENIKICPTPAPVKPLFKPSQTPQVRSLKHRNFRNNTKLYNRRQDKDLSFSFLVHENQQYTQQESLVHKNNIQTSVVNDDLNISYINGNIERELEEENGASYSSESSEDKNDSMIDLQNFKPAFVSTPKQRQTDPKTLSKISRRRSQPKKYPNISSVNKAENTTNNQNSLLNPTKDIKQQSMSSRLLSVINESCTTFVKSVKSIFRSKREITKENGESKANDGSPLCNYSFTNYMRKRDALLEGEFSVETSFSEIYKIDSCKTCKDTIILQQKMAEDDHLKQTVKKLKMGINLYGCDFKRISKAMWPRDKYMTPTVLYNLYRKLIVKGGHGNHEFRQKAYNIMRKK